MGFNKTVCKPPLKDVKDKYYELFRGKNGPDDDDGGEGTSSAVVAVVAASSSTCVMQ